MAVCFTAMHSYTWRIAYKSQTFLYTLFENGRDYVRDRLCVVNG